MQKTIALLLAYLAISSMGYGMGQVFSKPVPQKIRGEKIILDSREQIPEPELAFPALSATRIDASNSSNPQFFYDEYRKRNKQERATLLIKAPLVLDGQYSKSKNPIIRENPWFVLKGLQELKTLLHSLKTTYLPTLSASQLNCQRNNLKIFEKFAYQAFQAIVPMIAALKTEKISCETFGQQWLDAPDAKTERLLLYRITTHITKERLFPAARELTGFIGVLGHALPKDVRMICLNEIEEMCANELFAGTNKETAQSNFDLVQAVNKDMFHGPDAQAIAEMAIRDRLFTQKTK